MTNNDENTFEGYDFEPGNGPRPKRSTSRSFFAALVIMSVVVAILVIAMIVVVPLMQKSQDARLLEQAALINAQYTATSMASTQMAVGLGGQELSQVKPQVPTVIVATPTPVIVVMATEVPALKMAGSLLDTGSGDEADSVVSGGINRTATIAALLTQAVSANYGSKVSTYVVYPASGALPNTGFIDEIGLPGMIGMAFVLFGVVVFVRRFRLTPKK
jgi:LPXTG-motif cell wall-anchored protein